jgi:hypothetical protein
MSDRGPPKERADERDLDANEEECNDWLRGSDRMKWLANLAVFVLVLAVMKFFFGWNISIIGSVVLTLILSVTASLINRR